MQGMQVSTMMLAGGLGVFLWELRVKNTGLPAARTALANLIVLVQIFHLFNCRTLKHSALSIGLFTNRWVVAGALTMLLAQVLFTHSTVLNHLFHTALISAGAWLLVTTTAFLVFIVIEIEKWLRFRKSASNVEKAWH
jgi:magnesium-transporting ATPase (P-type)